MNGKEKLLLTKLVRYAMEHSSPEALKKYLKDHPNADPSKHTVKSEGGNSKSKSKGKGGPEKTISVEDAQKAFDKADKAVKDLGLSVSDIKNTMEFIDGLKEEGYDTWMVNDQKTGPGNPRLHSAMSDLKDELDGADLTEGLDDDLKKSVKLIYDLADDKVAEILAPEEAMSPKKTQAKLQKFREGLDVMLSTARERDVDWIVREDLRINIENMLDSIERKVKKDLDPVKLDAVSKMQEASKALASAKAKAPSEEKEEKKEESKPNAQEQAKANKQERMEEKAKGKGKGKGKGKSKSRDEMSAAELKEEAEEAIKNSDMDPEEKKKAIKRMKKKSPADLKAMLSSMGDDEEGEDSGSKKAFLRRSARLGSEIKANSVKIAQLEAINTLMGELQHNQRRIASLEARLKKKGGAKDKPKKLSKGTVKIPVKGGHVLLSAWALNHITSHNEVGTGSVFSKAINEKTLISLIQKAPVRGSGGLYSLKASGAGFNLVLPITEALSLPDAVQTTVQKDERGGKITVPAIKTTAPLSSFKTSQISLVIRPSNPQFLPDDAKASPEILKDVKDGRSWSLLTAFPGDPNIPPASQWNGKYAVILPS